MKKIFFVLILLIIRISCVFSHDIFDLLSPKYSYVFEHCEPKGFMSFVPGKGALGALEVWTETDYPIDIMYHWDKVWNSDDILFFLMMQNKYSIFTINEMNIEYDGKKQSLFSNKSFYLPEEIYMVEEKEMAQGPCILTNGSLFWTRLEFCKSVNPNDKYPHIHWEKIFKGKKDGEIFPCKIILKYHFDDEEIKELIYSYDVLVQKW